MGSRAQLKVVSEEFDTPIFLYTHWGSFDLNETLAEGLERSRPRWGDAEYATRILFNTLTKGDEEGETGYGIGTSEHGDLDYPAVEVNLDDRKVRYRRFDQDLKEIGFEDFITDKPNFIGD